MKRRERTNKESRRNLNRIAIFSNEIKWSESALLHGKKDHNIRFLKCYLHEGVTELISEELRRL